MPGPGAPAPVVPTGTTSVVPPGPGIVMVPSPAAGAGGPVVSDRRTLALRHLNGRLGAPAGARRAIRSNRGAERSRLRRRAPQRPVRLPRCRRTADRAEPAGRVPGLSRLVFVSDISSSLPRQLSASSTGCFSLDATEIERFGAEMDERSTIFETAWKSPQIAHKQKAGFWTDIPEIAGRHRNFTRSRVCVRGHSAGLRGGRLRRSRAARRGRPPAASSRATARWPRGSPTASSSAARRSTT